MKLFKYIYYSEINNEFAEGAVIKQPFVWAEVAPDSEYDDVTTTKAVIDLIKENYRVHQNAGLNYFEEIRARLVLNYQNGEIPAADIYGIEAVLEPVVLKLQRGDWMTASNQMSGIVPMAPLSQSLYDEINNFITNYIADNY